MAKNSQTTENQPETDVSIKRPKLSDDVRAALGTTVMQTIDINLGNRQELDDFLDYANAMYEMRTQPRNDPWEGAANIVVPVVAAETDEMTSRLTGSAIQPRPFTVRGNDPRSSQYAHVVEQFFNAEFDKNNWYDAFETGIHLAARDGTSILEVLWEKTTTKRKMLIEMPVMDEDGAPKVDENGAPVMEKKVHMVEQIKYDAPKFVAVELRDFLLIPAHAPSIEDADGVARKRYMPEKTLHAMTEAGAFDADAVESVLRYVATGQGDLSYDRQGNDTYTISNRINVVDTAVAPPEGMTMARGPVEVWQVLTDQYDLDGDGVPEENYIWVHDRSRIVLGYSPYEYEGGRPYFDLSIMPRPNRFYGFGVPERTRGVQEEADAVHNGRLDWQDYAINPTMYKTPGARIRDEDMGIGPGKMWDVSAPTDIGFITLQDVPQSNPQEESLLLSYASRSTGAPQAPGQQQGNSGRVTARGSQNAAAIQGMQVNKMVTRVRRWMLRAFEFAHLLYLRYGMDQMQTVATTKDGSNRLTIPRELLSLDYTLGIAGLGGPLDKESRRQDAMLMYQMLMQNPLVAGDMQNIYALTRWALETFDLPEVTSFIGTLEQAQEKGQQQAQAQQQQANQEMALQLLSHTKIGPKSGGANAAAPPSPVPGQ